MSRHQRTSERSSTVATSAAVSTSVPTCGCNAWVSPYSAHSSSSSPSMPTRCCHSRADSSNRGDQAGSTTTAVTNIVAPAAANSSAVDRASASVASRWPGSWSTTGTNPPISDTPLRLEHLDEGVRVARQEPGRAELGGRDAERAHLAEHPVGRQHHAPPRDLADAPGDRGAADAVDGDHGLVKFVARSMSRRVP